MPPEESPEAKYDRLKNQLQDLILTDYPNPERKGCPGDAVLKELADRPLDQPVEDGPHWHHGHALFRVLPRIPGIEKSV